MVRCSAIGRPPNATLSWTGQVRRFMSPCTLHTIRHGGDRFPALSSIGHATWSRRFIRRCHRRAREWSTRSSTSSRLRLHSRKLMTGSAAPLAAGGPRPHGFARRWPCGLGCAGDKTLKSRSATPHWSCRCLSAGTCGASNDRMACPRHYGKCGYGRALATGTWTTSTRNTGHAWRSTGRPRTRLTSSGGTRTVTGGMPCTKGSTRSASGCLGFAHLRLSAPRRPRWRPG